MDTRTGEIYTRQEVEELLKDNPEYAKFFVPLKSAKRPPRNGPCPCGSGKKYKHCCWNRHMQHERNKEEK